MSARPGCGADPVLDGASIPDDARSIVDRYLALADRPLSGRIEGLYLAGSIALGDYRPAHSDVDYIAVTGEPLTAAELGMLEGVHRELTASIPAPWFDGIYVTWRDLAGNPLELSDVPFTHEGAFRRTGAFEANPSTWLTLRNHPLAVRGPTRPAVWHDRAVTSRWNAENLNSYWRRLLEQGRSAAGRAALLTDAARLDRAIVWCVPGVTRLHYTIVTDDVTSKSGACRYALDRFPARWHPILRVALALRGGGDTVELDLLERYRDMLDYMEFAIADASARTNRHG